MERANAGETYVVYGGASAPGTDGVLELPALDGTNGFTLTGIDRADWSGFSVSSAGDVNGDGYDDLIIGARFRRRRMGSSVAGESYVVYGGASAPGTGGVFEPVRAGWRERLYPHRRSTRHDQSGRSRVVGGGCQWRWV